MHVHAYERERERERERDGWGGREGGAAGRGAGGCVHIKEREVRGRERETGERGVKVTVRGTSFLPSLNQVEKPGTDQPGHGRPTISAKRKSCPKM